jgi:hypothetical protein
MINRAIERKISDEFGIELIDSRPLKFEWVCVGEYNGVDIPGIEIDTDYKVWQAISNPEYSCEVIVALEKLPQPERRMKQQKTLIVPGDRSGFVGEPE